MLRRNEEVCRHLAHGSARVMPGTHERGGRRSFRREYDRNRQTAVILTSGRSDRPLRLGGEYTLALSATHDLFFDMVRVYHRPSRA